MSAVMPRGGWLAYVEAAATDPDALASIRKDVTAATDLGEHEREDLLGRIERYLDMWRLTAEARSLSAVEARIAGGADLSDPFGGAPIQEAAESEDAGEPLVEARFDPSLHPRDRLGQFIEVLGSLPVGGRVRLPSGVRVERSESGFLTRAGIHTTEGGLDKVAQKALSEHDRLSRDSVETFADNVTLPKSGKVKEIATRAISALDQVLRLPEMPTVKLKATTGKNKAGSYHREVTKDLGRVYYVPDSIFVSVSEDLGDYKRVGAPHLTSLHEIAHFVDNEGFEPADQRNRYETLAALMADLPDERREKLPDHVRQNYPRDEEPSPLARWWERVQNSEAYDALSKDVPMWDYETHKYLLHPKETWARSFAQYIALRSGDAKLREELDSWLSLPLKMTKTSENWKGQQVSYEIDTPGSLLYRQWQPGDFQPIAEEMDRLFEELGWLRRRG